MLVIKNPLQLRKNVNFGHRHGRQGGWIDVPALTANIFAADTTRTNTDS